MPDQKTLIIGTRGSPLALAQADNVTAQLEKKGINTSRRIIKTSGDQITDRKLIEAGGKGLFTKEIDLALLEEQIDLAVHSLKDVPSIIPDGLILCAFLPREDARDTFISASAARLDDLPQGAKLGTASARRTAQALSLRPDLDITLLRGNVGTRLAKVEAGEIDATFLALAGLNRLNLTSDFFHPVPIKDMPTAPCQGIVAIMCREADKDTQSLITGLNDEHAEIAALVERAVLQELDGSCRIPLATHCKITPATKEKTLKLSLSVVQYALDGQQKWSAQEETTLKSSVEDTYLRLHDFGQKAALKVKQQIEHD